jgi:hypothetical protein
MEIIDKTIDKTGMFDESTITQILFNATHTSVAVIKDKPFLKQMLKLKLNHWFKSGNAFWNVVKQETKQVPETIDMFEDLSGYIYEVTKIALEKPNYKEFLEKIKVD